MATIKDVARIAGVSVTTVSATINGTAPVSEKMKAKVWAAIEQAGYQPDPIARNLRMGKSKTIGLIVPDISTPWAAHLAKAMQRALSDVGYNMLFSSSDDDPDREFREIGLFMAHRVAGLVIAPTSHGENYAERLSAAVKAPAILVDRKVPDADLDAVTDDNVRGAELLARYLLKLGHRDIAFLVGRPGISASYERFDGFALAMQKSGFTLREDLVKRSIYKTEQAHAAVQQLMLSTSPPTAIACISLAQLMGTMAGLEKLGLRVPEDVSVVSFDGFHPAEGWHPSMTSLTQDIEAISTKAAQMLLQRIDGDYTGARRIVRVAPSLTIRTSCSPVLQKAE
ncbi:transcriptional regulator, LacI family [Cohaesibacter sp. ES.047]|uniref:LacI family DNA-binding transcriptional regulator n=1 Tax=Cohaesibacter sp. ES.047 TaxID=1798205 RepID=UPI000BBF8F80|nr:LacI family DNA-binding transcriptional regulator [Cohaesibacter sp. ES.047]SNY90719.1 transcriptional regulator, LacI family [Cohaesibacter sp. ES.047]